ncbi:hypothetical protein V5F77_02865 [Xanthobacter sp. DSM 24535]|uniref:hypothetical protein n=1 Tax=Roseixanthobacter psychrophilus TaxID=3119917 RepID=UPI00372B2E52
MTAANKGAASRAQAEKTFEKLQGRAAEPDVATPEYEKDADAARAKMAKLKALREAREAAETAQRSAIRDKARRTARTREQA